VARWRSCGGWWRRRRQRRRRGRQSPTRTTRWGGLGVWGVWGIWVSRIWEFGGGLGGEGFGGRGFGVSVGGGGASLGCCTPLRPRAPSPAGILAPAFPNAPPAAQNPTTAPQLAVQTHVDASKAQQAMLRACIDLGRLEMKAKEFDASKAVLTEALGAAREKAGEESQEAGERGRRATAAGAVDRACGRICRVQGGRAAEGRGYRAGFWALNPNPRPQTPNPPPGSLHPRGAGHVPPAGGGAGGRGGALLRALCPQRQGQRLHKPERGARDPFRPFPGFWGVFRALARGAARGPGRARAAGRPEKGGPFRAVQAGPAPRGMPGKGGPLRRGSRPGGHAQPAAELEL
jgi:hypothetical protein